MDMFYKFEEFVPQKNNTFINYIKKQENDRFPKLFLFLNNPEEYYRSLGTLPNFLFREKRLLIFDSPNRAKITHEHDYEGYIHSKDKPCQFLFSPASKLSWLKIYMGGKRLVIASQNSVKRILLADLQTELATLIHDGNFSADVNQVLDDLWKDTRANPCFVYLPDDTPANFLLEFTYYSSVVEDNSKKTTGISCNLIDERNILFPYKVNSPNNPWLYVQAPNKYEVDVTYTDGDGFDCIKVDSDDPNIVSRYMKRLDDKANTCNFTIRMKVPSSLKFWYHGLMTIGILLIIILVIQIIMGSIGTKHDLVPVPLAMSIVAAFIATRGWMIQDESILRRYSKVTIWVMGLLVILPIINSIVNLRITNDSHVTRSTQDSSSQVALKDSTDVCNGITEQNITDEIIKHDTLAVKSSKSIIDTCLHAK